MKIHKIFLSITASVAAIFCSTPAHAAVVGFNDTFDTIDPSWTTDRYDPSGFNSVVFDGDNRLEITISSADSAALRPAAFSSAFYNTQGKQRTVSADSPWSLKGSLHVDSWMLQDSNPFRVDLWGRTGTIGDESFANYPIFGLAHFDPSDPFNLNSPSVTSTWRLWDDDAGGWVNLSSAIQTGWNDLEIQGSSAGYEYFLNGSSVYTDTTTLLPLSLTTGFVQAYAYGGDYAVHWDNVSVSELSSSSSVPDGGSTLMLLGIPLLGLCVSRAAKLRVEKLAQSALAGDSPA